jgi:hypothetical protein
MYLEPCLQIRSDSIIQYNLAPRLPVSRDIQPLLTNNLLAQKTYTGMLTPGAKKRMIKSVEFMLMSARGKTVFNTVMNREQPMTLNFLTLTLYSTDRDIRGAEAHKTMLEPMLQWMRRVHDCQMYLWKAELQERGQIHYHITFDQFIHFKEVAEKWNELQKKHGYLDTFYAKFGHWDAPSIKIHAVKDQKKWGTYIIKEITKNIQNKESVGGKVWDCSLNLKGARYFTTIADGEYQARIADMIDKNEIQAIYTDHCTIFRIIDKPAYSVLSDNDKREYIKIMDGVRNAKAPMVTIQRKQPVTVIPDKIKPQPKAKQLKIELACNSIEKQKIKVFRPDRSEPPPISSADHQRKMNAWLNDYGGFSSN